MATPRRNTEAKEKKRALPTEFERQVAQIRTDISTVRANLQRAESALASVPASASETGAVGASAAAGASSAGSDMLAEVLVADSAAAAAAAAGESVKQEVQEAKPVPFTG